MDDFKGNSNASKKPGVEREKLAPINANVTVKKESEFSKLKKQLFAEDGKTVRGFIFTDVIIPGLKRLIVDIVKGGIDMFTYGSRTPTQNGNGIRNVSYQNYYTRNNNQPQQVQSGARPGVYSVNAVIFDDRGSAEDTLASLREQIDKYGSVSVADFYDVVSFKYEYTDLKYGWTDLRDAEIQRHGNGYIIRFPKIVVI